MFSIASIRHRRALANQTCCCSHAAIFCHLFTCCHLAAACHLQDNLGRLHGAHGRPGLVHVLTCCLKADPAERWAPGRVLGDYQLWTEKFKLLKVMMFFVVRRCFLLSQQ